VTPSSWDYCSRLQQSRCHAVIDDLMITFTAYTAAETVNAFIWTGQPPKLSLSMAYLNPHLMMNFVMNGILIGSDIFAELTGAPNPQRSR